MDDKLTKDLVSLHSPMQMNTTWIFEAPVTIQYDLDVRHTVNGVDLKLLKPQGPLEFHPHQFNVDVDIEFEQPVVFHRLYINSTINDLSFEALFGDIISFVSL